MPAEYQAGGDKVLNLSTSTDLCDFGLPGQEQFEIEHKYDSGSLRTSRYLNDSGGVFQELFVHTIDASTGLVASTTDPAGFTTAFDYDALGRLTEEVPGATAGQDADARVDYQYVNATATERAFVEIVRSTRPRAGPRPSCSRSSPTARAACPTASCGRRRATTTSPSSALT